MFELLQTCAAEDICQNAKVLAEEITSEEMAKKWFLTLLNRASVLTEEQEKILHQLGRKIRIRFGMRPVGNG